MIKRNIKSEGKRQWWEIEITPDEIARELIRQDKNYGACSGGIQRLAVDCVRHRFKPSIPSSLGEHKLYPDIFVKFVYPEGFEGSIGTWGYDTRASTIMLRWVERNPEIQGYRFVFEFGYADIPDTLVLIRPDRKTKDPYK